MAEFRRVHTLIIGSGAAGLAAAVRLNSAGIAPVIYTEGLKMGTSINTGSDKQTYYKLGMYGADGDSPVKMARDIAAGGSVHGDIALVEAALSPLAFYHLVSLGVPFPHDEFGQYAGYKTDHDPARRATSCGPYTSRDMCRALTAAVKRQGIEVKEKRVAVSLIVLNEKNSTNRCCGAVFVNTKSSGPDAFETVLAENVILAVGGPGGLYQQSVYPAVHTGGIGLAVEIGARARNLAESQFGMASVKFRWNVSGSYMQVLPRIISRAVDGKSDEREFLREYFSSTEEMYDAVFLKGYQWPFSAGHVPGSSLIDVFVNREIVERGRRVFLDFRTDPADFDFSAMKEETRTYLKKSGAADAASPLERLKILNEPAITLYREHGIDLETEPLEIAICAQHNNGGLAGNVWWESENVTHLFPIGEVNGSHGVTRPGGTALNAGQVGAFRAAEWIAAQYSAETLDEPLAAAAAEAVLEKLMAGLKKPSSRDWKTERRTFQHRMSAAGAFLREKNALARALAEAVDQRTRLESEGFAGENVRDVAEILRNRQLLSAQIIYLEAILKQVSDGVGSRGSALVLTENGIPVHPLLPDHFRMMPEDPSFRMKTLESELRPDGSACHVWHDVRPVPEPDGWFETVWHDFRTGTVYQKESIKNEVQLCRNTGK